jgi:hypothetical protein
LLALLILLATVLSLCVEYRRSDASSPLRGPTGHLDPSNVCITNFLANTAEPRQKEWISRSLNLSVFEDRDAYALWDMSNRMIRIRPLKGGKVEVREMSDEVFARGQDRMTHATGLVPFDKISDLPEGAIWEKVVDPNVATQVSGTQAYDLIWTTPMPTIPPTRRRERFRFFVDPRTHLPARVEMYSQARAEPRLKLYKTLVVSYPTDQDIQTLVQTLFPGLQ